MERKAGLPKQKKKKKQRPVTIPRALANILAAEKKDLKYPAEYDNLQYIAKAMLRVLMAVK